MQNQRIANYYLFLVIILAGIILAFFHAQRFNSSNLLPLYDSYKFTYSSGNFSVDTLLNVNYMFSAYDSSFFLIRVLPFITGIITLIIGYLILSKIFTAPLKKYLMLLIYILSPLFIYSWGIPNNYYLPVFFLSLGIFLLLSNRYIPALASLLAAFAINQNIFFVLLLSLIVLMDKNHPRIKLAAIIVLIVSSVLIGSLNSHRMLQPEVFLREYISDFGAEYGFGAFGIILSCIGIIAVWKSRQKHYIVWLGVISIIFCSFYDKGLIIFADILMVYYASLGLAVLIEREWESPMLKSYVIILIICGLVFSSGSYLKKISMAGPYSEEANSLSWLRLQEQGIVLSDYEYGYLIESLSGMPAFTTKTYFLFSREKSRINMTNNIFLSRDFEEITGFFDKEKIRYIWINSAMKRGKIWKKDDEGMILILENSGAFKKMYDSQGIQIWKYVLAQ